MTACVFLGRTRTTELAVTGGRWFWSVCHRRAISPWHVSASGHQMGQLPRTLQRDMRAFFGTYTKACKQADALLFQAGNAAAIDEACQRALPWASSCRTTSTSIEAPWTPSNRSCEFTRAVAGRTSAKSKAQT